jgi:hypothetical protein
LRQSVTRGVVFRETLPACRLAPAGFFFSSDAFDRHKLAWTLFKAVGVFANVRNGIGLTQKLIDQRSCMLVCKRALTTPCFVNVGLFLARQSLPFEICTMGCPQTSIETSDAFVRTRAATSRPQFHLHQAVTLFCCVDDLVHR